MGKTQNPPKINPSELEPPKGLDAKQRSNWWDEQVAECDRQIARLERRARVGNVLILLFNFILSAVLGLALYHLYMTFLTWIG